VALTLARTALDDLPVGDFDAGQQAVLFLRHPGVEVEGPREVFGRGGAKEIHDGFGCQLASDVASAMTAHAVRNDVKLVVLKDREAVFVVIPLESYVSESGCDSAHFPSKT
jgi:hypothetical protein